MNGEIFNSQINSNNNNMLLEIVNDLHNLMNYSKDNIIIKTLGKIINKMNNIINENKKNTELIINQISLLNKKIDELSIKNKELKTPNGIYVGQVVNGLKEGKGIFYWNSGSRYEGDWRNDKMEGKGIFYHPDGDRQIGDYLCGQPVGKHAFFSNGKVTINNFKFDPDTKKSYLL